MTQWTELCFSSVPARLWNRFSTSRLKVCVTYSAGRSVTRNCFRTTDKYDFSLAGGNEKNALGRFSIAFSVNRRVTVWTWSTAELPKCRVCFSAHWKRLITKYIKSWCRFVRRVEKWKQTFSGRWTGNGVWMMIKRTYPGVDNPRGVLTDFSREGEADGGERRSS